MSIFIFCVYIVVCVVAIVATNKHSKSTRELIDALVQENDLLREQNKKLSDIIKKYGIN